MGSSTRASMMAAWARVSSRSSKVPGFVDAGEDAGLIEAENGDGVLGFFGVYVGDVYRFIEDVQFPGGCAHQPREHIPSGAVCGEVGEHVKVLQRGFTGQGASRSAKRSIRLSLIR